MKKKFRVALTYSEGIDRRSAGLADMLMRPDLQPEIEDFFEPQEALNPIMNNLPFYYFVMLILRNVLAGRSDNPRCESQDGGGHGWCGV